MTMAKNALTKAAERQIKTIQAAPEPPQADTAAAAPAITDEESERAFLAYTQARNKPREKIALALYPAAVATIREYDELESRLADQEDLAPYAGYHQTLLAPVAPYIQILRDAATAIQTVVETVEANAPGTFGIENEPAVE